MPTSNPEILRLLREGTYGMREASAGKSEAWARFGIVVDEHGNDVGFAACKSCYQVVTYKGRCTGTTTLRRHHCKLAPHQFQNERQFNAHEIQPDMTNLNQGVLLNMSTRAEEIKSTLSDDLEESYAHEHHQSVSPELLEAEREWTGGLYPNRSMFSNCGTAVGGEMFALVFFPSLRSHAVVELKELLTANADGTQVYLELGGGQRMLIEVVDVGTRNAMQRIKTNHMTKVKATSNRGAKRARVDENGEHSEQVDPNETHLGSSSSDDGIVCSCTEPTSESSELQRLRAEVTQLRTDLDNVLAALGIKQRLTPTDLMPDDERFAPDDMDYTYVSKTDVVLVVRKAKSVTAFARQVARKLFTVGPDKCSRMRDKIDKERVEWLRRLCCAYYPCAEWTQQCAQWVTCMRAIDNYTVWFQNRSSIGNGQTVLSDIGQYGVKDEPTDGESQSFNMNPPSEDTSGPSQPHNPYDSILQAAHNNSAFNMTVTVNELGEVVVPT